MAQKYTDELAVARLENGNCPECGDPQTSHDGAGGANCTLTDNGVAQRLAEYWGVRQGEDD